MKQRIVVINQAWSNHGDEAAHKALVRMLASRYPEAEISILVNMAPDGVPGNYELYRPQELPQVNYIWFTADAWFFRALKCMKLFPLFFTTNILVPLRPSLRKLRSIIASADYVVSAPGGVDIGPYRNWNNLFRLIMALHAGIPTAIYSPSIGPLPDETSEDLRFSRIAKNVLQKVRFLSLRDDKSQAYAREIGINYIPSADTAFLDNTIRPVPSELSGLLRKPYAVYVPNAVFKWHPVFRTYPKEVFENFYRQILMTLIESGLHVVMLPQLFGTQNDENYFRELAGGFPDASVAVIPDHYSCEIQQAIIRDAAILIGARYHSVVFSIKNHIPFFALSYEHKISNLLTLAGLQDLMYDLHGIQSTAPETVCEKIRFVLHNRDTIQARVSDGYLAVRDLAQRTADEFNKRFPSGVNR